MKCTLPLLVAAASLPIWAEVKFTKEEGKIAVEIHGKPFTTFYYGPETPKPYLHPLRSASGKSVTRHFPMEEKAGEARDHPHHRGLWFTHGEVNGYDFWANEKDRRSTAGLKRGNIALKKLGAVKGGGKQGSIEATFEWQETDGKPILTEHRVMTFHSDPKLRIVDFDVRFTGIEKAKFGDTKEGTFALRMAAELDGKHSGKLTNAEGKVGEKLVWGKPSPWLDYWGQLEGETLGVTIMDHPSNPKHPTYWHSREYGLHAANIFGEHDFFNDKTRDGSLTLEPGKTWRFRYRVVIHPGNTEEAGIAALYDKFKSLK
jgi:hypothetical protein